MELSNCEKAIYNLYLSFKVSSTLDVGKSTSFMDKNGERQICTQNGFQVEQPDILEKDKNTNGGGSESFAIMFCGSLIITYVMSSAIS